MPDGDIPWVQFSIHPRCLRRPLRDRRVMLGSRFEAGPHHNNISPTACGAGSPSGKGKDPRDSLPAERRDERNGERRGSGERQPPWRGLARTNSRMWCSASPLLSFVCPCFSLFAFSSPPTKPLAAPPCACASPGAGAGASPAAGAGATPRAGAGDQPGGRGDGCALCARARVRPARLPAGASEDPDLRPALAPELPVRGEGHGLGALLQADVHRRLLRAAEIQREDLGGRPVPSELCPRTRLPVS